MIDVYTRDETTGRYHIAARVEKTEHAISDAEAETGAGHASFMITGASMVDRANCSQWVIVTG